MKLCNQVVVALHNLAMCEGMALAAKAGVEPGTMLQAISAGAAGSCNLAPRILAGDYRPGFKLAHQLKDLRLALEVARSRGLPLLGTALMQELYIAGEAAGLGEEGSHALMKVVERIGGIGS